MNLLYIDESGGHGVLALGGVYLPDSKYRKFNEDFDNFIEEHEVLSMVNEIHTDHIWNERGVYEGLAMDKRANICEEIAMFLSETSIPVFLGAYQHLYGTSQKKAYLKLLQKFVGYAAKRTSKAGPTNKQLLLVFDERHDIESDIFSKLTSEREKIIKQYQTSCALIDAGYSGNSQYSRLIQTADIVAFWVRQMAAIKKNPDLFNSKDDSRKIKLVEDIEKYWRKKLKIL